MSASLTAQLETHVEAICSLANDAADTGSGLSDLLVALEGARQRIGAVVLSVIDAFDAADGARRDGAYSTANWLAARTGERRSVAGSRVHLARQLRHLPKTAAALADGSITESHARVLLRARNSRTESALLRDEGLLVGAAGKLDADQLVQVVEHWLRHHDPDGGEPDTRPDVFHLSQTLDGRLKGDFDLGGDLALTVKATIDELVTQLLARDKQLAEVDQTDPLAGETTSRRRARALGELCERAAASPRNPARRRALVNLHTTVETLAERGDPTDWHTAIEQQWRAVLPLDLVRLWSCDSSVARIISDARGAVLDVGRSARTATDAQRRALAHRDGGCAVPGCDRPPGWTDAHHIRHWSQGGATDLDNLVLLCRHHHRRIHAGDLEICVEDARPAFFLPDGRRLVDPRAGPQPERRDTAHRSRRRLLRDRASRPG